MEAKPPMERQKPDYKRTFSLPTFGEPKIEKQRKLPSLSVTPSEELPGNRYSRGSSTESLQDAFDNEEETMTTSGEIAKPTFYYFLRSIISIVS